MKRLTPIDGGKDPEALVGTKARDVKGIGIVEIGIGMKEEDVKIEVIDMVIEVNRTGG